MKKIILIALIVTGVVAGSVLVGGFLSKNQHDTNPDSSTTQTANDTPTTSQSNGEPQNQTGTQVYTAIQVAQHSVASDCWIIISKSVYNVTEFIPKHPGGAERIIALCGKDATEAFDTQDGEGSHSSTADSLKQDYLIGSLQ